MNYTQLVNEFSEVKEALKVQKITPDDASMFLNLIISQLLLLIRNEEIEELILDIENYIYNI